MVFAVPRPLAVEAAPLGAIFNFLSDEAHGKRANYMAHRTEWFLSPPPAIFSLHSQLILSFTFFCGGSFTFFFGFLGPRTRTQLSWVDAKCEEDFLAIFTATAQMNDHYADLKWKQRLKWICNELSDGREQRERESERDREWAREGDRDKSESRRPTQCAAVSCNLVPATLLTVTARRRTCFNWIRRKLHLNAAACRQLQHVRGEGTGSCGQWKKEKRKEDTLTKLVSISWRPFIQLHSLRRS